MAKQGLPLCSWAVELFWRAGSPDRLAPQDWGTSCVQAGLVGESHGGGCLPSGGEASPLAWQVASGQACMGCGRGNALGSSAVY